VTAREDPETLIRRTLESVSLIAAVRPVALTEPLPDGTVTYAIYAATGEEVDIGAEGILIRGRELRIEIHDAKYEKVVAADREAIAALMASDRLTGIESLFDDWSEGRQPTIGTRRASVPLETAPEGVYRRIRTVTVSL